MANRTVRPDRATCRVGTTRDGLVIIVTSQPVDNLKMAPNDALQVAQMIVECAAKAAQGVHVLTLTKFDFEVPEG